MKTIQELIDKISTDEKLKRNIYEVAGIYFVVCNDIWEISNDASCSPKGGWFPQIYSGPNNEERQFITEIIDKYDVEETFFEEYLAEIYVDPCDIEADELIAYFEENENEESVNKIKGILKELSNKKSPFSELGQFATKFRRLNLDHDTLYYDWEGEVINFYENICDYGKKRGSFESLSDEVWIDILTNIEDYVVSLR